MSTEEQATATAPTTEASPAAPAASEAPKEEGVKVFAGNLSYKSVDDDLRAIFEPVGGEILDLQIVFRGQRSSGYGFVTYKTQEDAERAIDALNKKDIDGRELAVELAKPPQPKEKKIRPKKAPAAGRAPRAEDAVDGEEETAAAAAADGEAKPKAKRTRPPRRRGAKKAAEGEVSEGAVGENGAPAASAPKATRPPKKSKAAGAAARIDDAETGEQQPKEPKAPRAPRLPRAAPTGEPSKTLVFVANLPFTLEDEGLKAVFANAGVTVHTARIVQRKFGARRSKGFGFVDCASEEEQKKALAVDGTEVEGRALAVKVALSSQQDPAEEEAVEALAKAEPPKEEAPEATAA